MVVDEQWILEPLKYLTLVSILKVSKRFNYKLIYYQRNVQIKGEAATSLRVKLKLTIQLLPFEVDILKFFNLNRIKKIAICLILASHIIPMLSDLF